MDRDVSLEGGSKPWSPGTPDDVRAEAYTGKNPLSFSRAVTERFQQELSKLWPSGIQKSTCLPMQPHGESSFRFLLANEVKRSERSGHSFHVLLTYFEEADRGPTQIEDQVRDTLVPILSNMFRET